MGLMKTEIHGKAHAHKLQSVKHGQALKQRAPLYEQKEKIEKEIKRSFRHTLSNIKVTNENIPGISEGEKREHEAGKIS